MIHKGEKPFQCKICSKRFREKSNYNFHMKKHEIKLKKNEQVRVNKRHNFEKKDLIMDNNINNFYIFENKKMHKLSDISNSNSTNSNSNNSFEINNKLFEEEKNDNELIVKNKDILNNTNQKNNYSEEINLNNHFLFNKEEQYLINFGREDDLKNIDEQSIKYDLNNTNNKYIFKNIEYTPFSKTEEILNQEDVSISKTEEEKEKNEPNYENLSIANEDYDKFYISNDLNNKINLREFNNNFYQSYFPLNFESTFINQFN